jgi:rRNA small subunit pseudouridine methyltransferase Nep1
MINLVYVETSIELVPIEIVHHPSVRRNAKRRGKPPEETLLDRSLHHWAMKNLSKQEKRGRPDIIHYLLLEALGSPLNKEGKLKTWVNTLQDLSIIFDPNTRIPRDFNRFKSLIEQLFLDGRTPPLGDHALIEIRRQELSQLFELIKPEIVIALSSHGEKSSFESIATEISKYENPIVMIGAFPLGPFEEKTSKLANQVLSVYPDPLEAWTVNSRMIYEIEKALSIY